MSESGGVLLSPQLILTITTAIYVAILLICVNGQGKNLLECNTIFVLLLGCYVIGPMLIFVFAPESPFVNDFVRRLAFPVNVDEERRLVFCALLTVLGTGCGFALAPNPHRNTFSVIDLPWVPKQAATLACGLIACGIAMLIVFVLIVGASTLTTSSYVETYAASEGLGSLLAGVNVFFLGLCVLYLSSPKTENRNLGQYLAIAVFLLFALFIFRFGRRRPVLEIGAALLVLQHFWTRTIPVRYLAAIGAVLVAVISIVGVMRAYMHQETEVAFDALQEADITELIGRNMFEFYSTTLTTNQTMHLVNEGEAEFRFGATYLEAFIVLIPSFILRERPAAPSQWFVRAFDPEVAAAGGGYSYSHVAEGYLNFGYFGVFAAYVAIGWVVQTMVSFRKSQPASQGRLFVYAVFSSTLICLIRADFASVLKTYIVTMWVPAVIIGIGLSIFGQAMKLGRPASNSDHGVTE